jgi:SAM-dependent methyltransferase
VAAAWKNVRGRALRPIARRLGDAVLGERGLLANRFVSAKLLPLSGDRPFLLVGENRETDPDLPVPPPELWRRWGLTLDSYLNGGRADAERIVADVAATGVDPTSLERVLDFGCAEGRVLRFFPRGDDADLWGVDVNADRIAWCQQNLTPPFRFATTTTAPHLPFADETFDLVYAISVFTHISELADAWFLELLRIVRPGGHLYLTIHDEHTIELLLDEGADPGSTGELGDLVRAFDAETGVLSRNWAYFAVHADPGAQVFFRTSDLVQRWSLLAESRAVNPASIGYQTALIFRRGEGNPPRPRSPRFA